MSNWSMSCGRGCFIIFSACNFLQSLTIQFGESNGVNSNPPSPPPPPQNSLTPHACTAEYTTGINMFKKKRVVELGPEEDIRCQQNTVYQDELQDLLVVQRWSLRKCILLWAVVVIGFFLSVGNECL